MSYSSAAPDCSCDDPTGLSICQVHCKCLERWELCPLHTKKYSVLDGLHCRGVWEVLGELDWLFRWVERNAAVGPYCWPRMLDMRRQPHASLCIDDDCDLSGGLAHVGECEPCTCGHRHAIAECPERWRDAKRWRL